MEKVRHLLIVDDDPDIVGLLRDFLVQRGFRVSVAGDGVQMRQVMAAWSIDLVVLDVMLPGDDGFALCRQIREKSAVPILMLTAVTGEADRIVGLELGADDYLEKPFNPRELLARIKAILRRSSSPEAEDAPAAVRTFSFAGWVLHEGSRELRSPDQVAIHLSTGEYELLRCFLQHPQKILSRDDLAAATRGASPMAFDRSIDIQISRLRRKLDDQNMIKTVRGQGYLFAESVAAE